MPEIIDILLSRRSIPQFTPEPVDRGSLVLLLKAAMAAPTACNSQPWEFIVVTEEEMLDCIRARLPFARYNNPAAIVVCGNPRIAHNTAAREYWVMDCSTATENILIAAAGLGLGAVWIGIHPVVPFVRAVREALDIPEDVTPLGMMHVGYAAEEKPARTQYDKHKVYWQKYEKRKRRAKIKNAKLLP